VIIWKLNITDFFFTFAVECFIFSGWGGEKHTCFIISLSETELLRLHCSSDKDCKCSLLAVISSLKYTKFYFFLISYISVLISSYTSTFQWQFHLQSTQMKNARFVYLNKACALCGTDKTSIIDFLRII
jgi:hypothetical protein